MIYIETWFTLILIVLVVAGVTWSLMNSDDRRSPNWHAIQLIAKVLVMLFAGAIALTWLFDSL
jgi:heme/copper-type cytochrome/quinol oxidase subunit 4